MVPSSFVMLEALPRNPHGKVDVRALPAPGSDRAALGTAYVPLDAGIEESIGAVWREVLRVERVGREDNFFDLGGHSLALVQVQRRLRDVLGRDVSLVDLFRHPSVRALAAFLSAGSGEASSPARPPEERGRELDAGRERMRQRLSRRRRGDEGAD
jgi:aryl carrier-like protein